MPIEAPRCVLPPNQAARSKTAVWCQPQHGRERFS